MSHAWAVLPASLAALSLRGLPVIAVSLLGDGLRHAFDRRGE